MKLRRVFVAITEEEKKITQFKKARNFFKNLEDSSSNIKRRFSLDLHKKNNFKVRSGILNLPNVSEKFFINNLYKDVFGKQNGGFKGTPNQNGVANSLSSFPKNTDFCNKTNEKNRICYNLFANKTKCKKRKSIKTVFEVNY